MIDLVCSFLLGAGHRNSLAIAWLFNLRAPKIIVVHCCCVVNNDIIIIIDSTIIAKHAYTHIRSCAHIIMILILKFAYYNKTVS